jgi:transposase
MWTPNPTMSVWLYRRPTDMRKSYDGLSALVKNAMNENPLGGALFVFVNRRRTQMKCLYFSGQGYCLWSTRLECGQFRVRFDGEDRVRLELSTLRLLIDGIELDSVRRVRRFRPVFTGSKVATRV